LSFGAWWAQCWPRGGLTSCWALIACLQMAGWSGINWALGSRTDYTVLPSVACLVGFGWSTRFDRSASDILPAEPTNPGKSSHSLASYGVVSRVVVTLLLIGLSGMSAQALGRQSRASMLTDWVRTEGGAVLVLSEGCGADLPKMNDFLLAMRRPARERGLRIVRASDPAYRPVHEYAVGRVGPVGNRAPVLITASQAIVGGDACIRSLNSLTRERRPDNRELP
jgi:hypothetical protein